MSNAERPNVPGKPDLAMSSLAVLLLNIMSYDNQYSGDITKSQTADGQRVNGKKQDHQRQNPVFK